MFIELDKEDFNELIAKDKVLVDFNATWCGPCKMMKPVMEKIAKDKNIKVIGVDVDKHPLLAEQFKVMSIPTIYLFKDGEEIRHNIGFMPYEELENWIK